MARIRTIKPEFWSHEDLSAQPEPTHLLAAGLLNYADDYGWFNANIGLIKAACSPLREPSVSIPESLQRLRAIGYLRIGTGSDGKRYGQVCNFCEHQRVSHPTASRIADLSITWDDSSAAPDSFGNPPESFRPERKGKEGKGKEAAPDGAARGLPKEFHEQVIAAYHELLPVLPAVREWTVRRRRKLDARVTERVSAGKNADQIEYWRDVFGKVQASDFLCGRAKDWRCPGLEWLLEPEHFLKVIEGSYDNAGRLNGAGHAR